MNLDEYSQLKQKVDRLLEKKNRAEGALSQLMGRVKKEMLVDTIEEADDKLVVLEEKAEQAEKAYSEAYEVFEEEWGERLGV